MIQLVHPYYQLATSTVKRWHSLSVAREQTVAEHSMRVTMIAVCLGYALGPARFHAHDELEVRRLAEWHDLHEVEFGDVSHPVKRWLYDAQGMDFDQAAEAAFCQQLGIVSPMVEAHHLPRMLVEVADRLGAACFYWQEGRTMWHPEIGNVPVAIMRTAIRKLLMLLPELAEPGLAYLEAANVPADLLEKLRADIEAELAA